MANALGGMALLRDMRNQEGFLESLPLELVVEVISLAAADKASILNVRLTCRRFNALLSPMVFRGMAKMAKAISSNPDHARPLQRAHVLDTVKLDYGFLSALYWGLQYPTIGVDCLEKEPTDADFALLMSQDQMGGTEILQATKFYLTVGRSYEWLGPLYQRPYYSQIESPSHTIALKPQSLNGIDTK